eukprot:SAG11_NODE_3617_length_2335_cov_2.866279_2_plen_71_part_00
MSDAALERLLLKVKYNAYPVYGASAADRGSRVALGLYPVAVRARRTGWIEGGKVVELRGRKVGGGFGGLE